MELPVLRIHQSGRHRIRPMPSAAVAAAARQLQQGVRPLDLRRVLQHLHVLAVHQFGLRLLGLLHPRLTAALASAALAPAAPSSAFCIASALATAAIAAAATALPAATTALAISTGNMPGRLRLSKRGCWSGHEQLRCPVW